MCGQRTTKQRENASELESEEMSRVTFSEAHKTQCADSALLRARVLVLQRHLLIQKYICQIDSRHLA